MVIFGASGDLTYRKLIPALYALYNQQMLPEKLHVLGVSRTAITDEEFHEKMTDGIRNFSENIHLNEQQIEEFISHTSYFQMDMSLPDEYLRLKTTLNKININEGTDGNYMFYLSTPPRQSPPFMEGRWFTDTNTSTRYTPHRLHSTVNHTRFGELDVCAISIQRGSATLPPPGSTLLELDTCTIMGHSIFR